MLLTTPFLWVHCILVNGALWRLGRLYPGHLSLCCFGVLVLIISSIVAVCFIFRAIRTAAERRFRLAIAMFLGTFLLLYAADFGVCNLGDLLNSPFFDL